MSHPGRYQEVYGPREHSQDPSPLKVKNVQIGERRYVVCVNAEQARKDRADREAIVRSDDLEQLEDITVINAGRSFVIRSDLRGDAGKAIQAVGVALGPVVRVLNSSSGTSGRLTNDAAV